MAGSVYGEVDVVEDVVTLYHWLSDLYAGYLQCGCKGRCFDSSNKPNTGQLFD